MSENSEIESILERYEDTKKPGAHGYKMDEFWEKQNAAYEKGETKFGNPESYKEDAIRSIQEKQTAEMTEKEKHEEHVNHVHTLVAREWSKIVHEKLNQNDTEDEPVKYAFTQPELLYYIAEYVSSIRGDFDRELGNLDAMVETIVITYGKVYNFYVDKKTGKFDLDRFNANKYTVKGYVMSALKLKDDPEKLADAIEELEGMATSVNDKSFEKVYGDLFKTDDDTENWWEASYLEKPPSHEDGRIINGSNEIDKFLGKYSLAVNSQMNPESEDEITVRRISELQKQRDDILHNPSWHFKFSGEELEKIDKELIEIAERLGFNDQGNNDVSIGSPIVKAENPKTEEELKKLGEKLFVSKDSALEPLGVSKEIAEQLVVLLADSESNKESIRQFFLENNFADMVRVKGEEEYKRIDSEIEDASERRKKKLEFLDKQTKAFQFFVDFQKFLTDDILFGDPIKILRRFAKSPDDYEFKAEGEDGSGKPVYRFQKVK